MRMVVAGAGVFGAWTALLARRAGYEVVLVDRGTPANELSSSTGHSRIIRSAYGADQIYTELAQQSLRLWLQFFEARNLRRLFRETGVLWIAPPDEPGLRLSRDAFDRAGIAHEFLDMASIRHRYPQFALCGDANGLLERDAGALMAEDSVLALVEEARASGCTEMQAEVSTPIETQGRLGALNTSEGMICADHYVFACGSWLPKLFPDVLKSYIQPTRQELFFFDVPANRMPSFSTPRMPVWIDQTEPRIAYGFPDFDGAGFKIGFHQRGPDFDPDSGSRVVSHDAIELAREYLARRFPALAGAVMRSARVCHYENTPNGDLLIDRHPAMENVWLVGGGSGHGFKHAPAVAECALRALGKGVAEEPRFRLSSGSPSSGRRVV